MATLGVGAGAVASAHPPSAPEHGLDESTFYRLWSGDVDTGEAGLIENASIVRVVTAGTDVPLESPPAAIAEWNTGEHAEWPETDVETSVYPQGANLEQGRYVKDAHVSILAIEPSTTVLASPTEMPVHVADHGAVRAVVDYRVEVPPSSSSGDTRVRWRLRSARIEDVRLEIDGAVEDRVTGTDRPVLEFTDLGAYSGSRHTVRVEADVDVELERRVRTERRRCRTSAVTGERDCKTVRRTSRRTVTETVTVADEVDEVVDATLDVFGYWARYPDGDLGLVIYKDVPWLGFSLPAGDVRGVWRFYAARDAGWDEVVEASEAGTTRRHSPVHPLGLYAYAFEPGPTAHPSSVIEIVDVFGSETAPAGLPTEVHLDALTEPYVESFGLVVRVDESEATVDDVTAYGLVRGVETARTTPFAEVPIEATALELAVIEVTDETVTVEVSLTEAASGAPIATVRREGHVVLDGEAVETGADGTLRRTLPRDDAAVTARFIPGKWWHHSTGYVGASDVVYTGGGAMDLVAVLYRLGVPAGLFFLGVFLIDRITGWRLWPPWRGM